MSEDLAWLACAIDGEGSITISNGKYVAVTVYNTCFEFVEQASRIMEEIVGKEKLPIVHNNNVDNIPSYKVCYRIRLSGKPAQLVLQAVLPFLVIKEALAESALSLKLQTREEFVAKLNLSVDRRRRDKIGRFKS